MENDQSKPFETDVERSSTGKIKVGPLEVESMDFYGPNSSRNLIRTLRQIFDFADKKGLTVDRSSGANSDKDNQLLSEAIDRFITEMHLEQAKHQNITTTHHSLKLLLGILGDKLVRDIDEDDIHSFKRNIRWWPPGANANRAYHGLSVMEIIERGKALELGEPSVNTINNHMAKVSRFFKVLALKRKIAHSPLDGISVRIKKDPGPIKERFFNDGDLSTIFEKESYMAWVKGKPHRYWPPLLAYYTGARINEIAQLKLTDFEIIDGISCIQVRVSKDVGAGGVPLGTVNQKVKGHASIRTIPVSPHLIDLGLMAYIEDVRRTEHPRLFPHLSAGISIKNGRREVLGYSHSLVPIFSKYLKSKDFKQGVVFHAFRHTFASELREQGASIEQIESITGHLDSPGGRAGATLNKHYLHKRPKNIVQQDLATIKMLRPLVDVPVYEPSAFAASLAQKKKFHP